MQEQYQVIGETAGKIYKALENNGEKLTAVVQKEIDVESALFNQALGWLAREDKICFNKSNKGLKISLQTAGAQ